MCVCVCVCVCVWEREREFVISERCSKIEDDGREEGRNSGLIFSNKSNALCVTNITVENQ